MSLTDDAPGAEAIERMIVDRTPRPTHSNPWRDPEHERLLEMEALAEQIAAVEDELQHLRARYEQVEQWRPEPDPEPVRDLRGVKNAGTDERAEWAS